MFPDAEGRREMRGGEGKVMSFTVIGASAPSVPESANWTFRGGSSIDGLFGCRCGIAGGGKIGFGKGGIVL